MMLRFSVSMTCEVVTSRHGTVACRLVPHQPSWNDCFRRKGLRFLLQITGRSTPKPMPALQSANFSQFFTSSSCWRFGKHCCFSRNDFTLQRKQIHL